MCSLIYLFHVCVVSFSILGKRAREREREREREFSRSFVTFIIYERRHEKPVFGVCSQVRLKPACSAIEAC